MRFCVYNLSWIVRFLGKTLDAISSENDLWLYKNGGVSKIISFIPLTQEFLPLTYEWLHDPEIKRMTRSVNFTQQEQEAWFLGLKSRSDYDIYGVCYYDKPIGVVGIKKIDYKKKTGEFFCYIGDKEYWGLGIGKKMLQHAVNIAKNKNLKKLFLIVARNNSRAIKLYLSCGFLVTNKDIESLTMETDLWSST